MIRLAFFVFFLWTATDTVWAQSTRGQAFQVFLRDVRSYSGEDNHPNGWGSVNIPLLRISYSDYPDGIGEVIRSGPNPRTISNLVVDQAGMSITNAAGLSDAVWAWGQFIDHDLDLSDSHPDNGSIDIPVLDPADILFPTIFLNRANHTIVDGVREQINEITSFLDASQVYGSNQFRADYLRTFSGGKLKTSPGRLMPLNVDGLPNLGDDPDLFLAGDIRSNENVVLTSLHTLFVREHNRLAGRIRQVSPNASDEEIYQLARKIVNAEIQIITYREFLPSLLGPFAPDVHSRYRAKINPTIANEFSGALFRVGHTLLSPNLVIGDTGLTIALRDAFTNSAFIRDNPENVGHMLLGLSRQKCQEIDATIVDDVRTFLFLPPPFPIGLDLAAINMQRGREHGIPPYNEVRRAYGLPPVTDFDQISSDPVVQLALEQAYGTVDQIDPWLGGIAEDHLPGANVGPLVMRAIQDQFIRTRDGDRFFYTRDPDLRQPVVRRVINLNDVTLGKVIRHNTQADAPDDMFFVHP